MFQFETFALCFMSNPPIRVYMKNLFLLVMTASVFISCTRAVDTENAKVVIQLPQLSEATLKGEPAASKISILSDGISSEETSTEEFSSVEPTAFSGTAPINCYLVGIGGPENFLNVNFAGLIVNGVLQATYKFGPFIGLRKAGESIEFMAAPGENRVVYIFGVLASDINDCKDLQTEKPSKASFSKPYMLGQSSPLKFIAGQDVVVPVLLNQPVATNKMDDFFFATFGDKISLPPATMAVIENNFFPQNTLRKKSGTACEPLDITLRASGTSGPGILPYPIQASVVSQDITHASQSSPIIYEDFSNCLNNNSIPSVTIPAGQAFKRVWTRTSLSDLQSVDLSVAVSGLAPGVAWQNPTRVFEVRQETDFKFEIVAPRAAVKSMCLPFKVNFRKLYGTFPTTSTVNVNLTSNFYGGSAVVPALFFETAANCNDSANTNAITSISMISGTSSRDLYLKLVDDSNLFFGIQAVSDVASPVFVSAGNAGVQINKDTAVIPFVTEMRFNYKNYFKTGECIPLNMEFVDQKGNYLIPAIAATVTVLSKTSDLDVRVNPTDYKTCSTGSQLFAGSGTGASTSGETTEFYVSATTVGRKELVLKYSTGIQRTLVFDVIDPAW